MTAAPPQPVLIVDDDAVVRASISQALITGGYAVAAVGDGTEALGWLEKRSPSLILLDVEMPQMNGWQTLETFRERGILSPVLMLTQINDVPSRVRGLRGGADDYLGKPFETEELMARIAALIRRVGNSRKAARTLLLRDIVIDLDRKSATRAGKSFRLTKTEYTLLDLLYRAEGKPVTRELMLKELWGTATADSHTVDTHLWRLRRKLGDTTTGEQLIENLPGLGYVLKTASTREIT